MTRITPAHTADSDASCLEVHLCPRSGRLVECGDDWVVCCKESDSIRGTLNCVTCGGRVTAASR